MAYPQIRSLSTLGLGLALAAVLAGGCSPAAPTLVPDGIHSPYTGYLSAKYRDDANWLCRPNLPGDPCHTDLTTTEVHADGSRTVVPQERAKDPAVDCFYVYPTVDLGLLAGNHTDFRDLEPMRRVAIAQIAQFSQVCAVYAPLYRQVTIGTYFVSEARREAFLQTAFSDVLDAFLHYMGQYNNGRRVVLIGHSQGAEMISRLVRRVFEQDPALQKRLLAVMPIGGQVEVQKGQLAGATFSSIPLCTRPEEPGCVIAFRTHREGSQISDKLAATKPGNELACTNPAGIGDSGRKRLSRTYYPIDSRTVKLLHGVEGITTPFVLYRDYYDAVCAEAPAGYKYLAVTPVRTPTEPRQDPVDLTDSRLNGRLGTHILDMQFSQGDLIDLIARKIAANPG